VERVRQQLSKLKEVINSGRRPDNPVPEPVSQRAFRQPPGLDRLEQAMQVLQRDRGSTGEMRELSGVVEQLLALQRSQNDTGRRVAAQDARLPLGRASPASRVSVEIKALPEEEDTVGRFDSGRIEAMIPEEVVLVSGGELRMELVRDVSIGRQRVPAGTPVFGIASLSGERLRVTTDAITNEGRLFPVNLEVVDEDGMTGIYIPGAPVSEALRESAGQELSSLGSGLVSTNLTGEAANAGLLLARSMIGKKIRPVKVTIPAGYRVFLTMKNTGL